MKSSFLVESKKKNIYLVNIDKKSILLIHPLIYSFLQKSNLASYDSNDVDYYNRKLRYLKKHKLISETLNITLKPLAITAEKVEECIANTNQIVFETTERCNLKCKYCFYEELYDTREIKAQNHLTSNKMRKLIDYFVDKQSSYNASLESSIYISFYGGEPLLNSVLISDTIDYYQKNETQLRKPKYTITTNGTLLNKHIELLIQNNFRITVSLDGNKVNNSYRVFHNDRNSFDSIMYNLQDVRDKYPDYFKDNIVFNTVLHNKNSIEEVYEFFKTQFDTLPNILELNNSGIKDNKLDEFSNMSLSKSESLKKTELAPKITSENPMDNPIFHSSALFLHQYSWFVYKTYRHQLLGEKHEYLLSTGTCLPFSKKIFITADGKILPCEKISHEHMLGYIADDEIKIDCQSIADKYNKAISTLSSQCKSCYKLFACEQCLFYINSEKPTCLAYTNEFRFSDYLKENISFIEENPNSYQIIMKEILFN
jgi:uncharacterized protein